MHTSKYKLSLQRIYAQVIFFDPLGELESQYRGIGNNPNSVNKIGGIKIIYFWLNLTSPNYTMQVNANTVILKFLNNS